jgi:hypothetical protein
MMMMMMMMLLLLLMFFGGRDRSNIFGVCFAPNIKFFPGIYEAICANTMLLDSIETLFGASFPCTKKTCNYPGAVMV